MLLQESLREIWSVLRELDWFLACTIPLQCQVHATAVHYYWTPTVPKIVPEQSAPGAGVLPANFPAPRSLSLISPVRTQCPVRSAASLLLCPVFSSQPWTCNLILTSRMYMKVMCITSGLIFKGTEQAVPFFPAQCVWTCSHTGWMTCGGEPSETVRTRWWSNGEIEAAWAGYCAASDLWWPEPLYHPRLLCEIGIKCLVQVHGILVLCYLKLCLYPD